MASHIWKQSVDDQQRYFGRDGYFICPNCVAAVRQWSEFVQHHRHASAFTIAKKDLLKRILAEEQELHCRATDDELMEIQQLLDDGENAAAVTAENDRLRQHVQALELENKNLRSMLHDKERQAAQDGATIDRLRREQMFLQAQLDQHNRRFTDLDA